MTRKKPAGNNSEHKPHRLRPEYAIKHRYSIEKILEVKSRLSEALCYEYRRRKIEGPEFKRLVDICQEIIDDDAVDRDTLADALRPLVGIICTRALLDVAAHRLAGNIPRLRSRRAVRPWRVQQFFEWVPVQILSSRLERNGRGELGTLFRLKILAGTPCPLVVFQWWSFGKCSFLAHDFGFQRQRFRGGDSPNPLAFLTPEQFVTLRFMGLVNPERSDREPAITKIDFAGGVRRWNRAQIRRRTRIQFVCPKHYPETFLCHYCPVGYTVCPAGTHRYNYQRKPCPGCGEPEAYWDRETSSSECLDCYQKKLRQRPTRPSHSDED